MCVSDSFLKTAQKVVEAADFVFVQLIELEPGIYDKRHSDYARQDKIYMAWERKKEVLSKQYKQFSLNRYRRTHAPSVFLILYLNILLH
jgi:hypothetical protein